MASNYQHPTARSESPTNTMNNDNENENNTSTPTPAQRGTPAPAPAEAPAPAGMNLVFRDQTNNELAFKLKPTTKLKKAMDAFSARTQRERRTLRFYFEGERVLDDHSPESLEMQDGDVVDVHLEQIGGGCDA